MSRQHLVLHRSDCGAVLRLVARKTTGRTNFIDCEINPCVTSNVMYNAINNNGKGRKMRKRIQEIRAKIEALTAQVERLNIEQDQAAAIFDAAPDIDTAEGEWLKYYEANQPEMEAAGLYLHIERLKDVLAS